MKEHPYAHPFGPEDESGLGDATEHADEAITLMADEDTGRAVRLTWTDSGLSFHNGWQTFGSAGERARVMEVETVGIYMGQNEQVIMVAHSRDVENFNWNVSMAIMKAGITKKEWL